MRALRIVAGALVAVCGLALLTLAHDVRAWNRALSAGDTTYIATPASARWHADTWVPFRAGRAGLGLTDDLAVRRAEQAFVAALAVPRGYDNGARQARARATAEIALADVVGHGSQAQASRAGNLLGILVAGAESGADVSVGERAARDAFDAAIRADPTSGDPKYNLELLLRRIRVIGTREGPGSGAGNRGDSLEGAGAGKPGSGY